MPGRPCCDGTRVFACALVTGLLFASLTGLQAGQTLDGDGPRAGVQFGFAPAPALFGFVAGALVGTLVGLLWGRPGVAGLLGMALVAGLGALVGLEVAGLAGAESRTVVEGNAVGTEYGPRPGVLAAGAAVGAAAGAVIAWRFRARPADRA
jgi:hypothetical protein